MLKNVFNSLPYLKITLVIVPFIFCGRMISTSISIFLFLQQILKSVMSGDTAMNHKTFLTIATTRRRGRPFTTSITIARPLKFKWNFGRQLRHISAALEMPEKSVIKSPFFHPNPTLVARNVQQV